MAQQIQPRDQHGAPNPAGKIVLLTDGMSNATQEISAFKRLADADLRKNPQVVIGDGAQGGADAEQVKNPAAPYWATVDERLRAAGDRAAHAASFLPRAPGWRRSTSGGAVIVVTYR